MEVKDTIEIPVNLLKHLIRQTGNNQAKHLMRRHLGIKGGAASVLPNVVEPEVQEVEKTERKKEVQKDETKPTPEAKTEKIKQAKEDKAAVDKAFPKKKS